METKDINTHNNVSNQINIVHHHYGGVLKISSLKYIDQLDPSNNPWNGTKRNLLNRLRSNYNIGEDEYVNTILRGDKNLSKICEAPRCSNHIPQYLDPRTRGNKTCSASCKFSKIQLELSSKGLHGAQGISNPFNDLNHQSKANKTKFINQFGDKLLAYLYVTNSHNGFIKFGITTTPHRRGTYGLYKDEIQNIGLYKSIHILRSGSVEWIAELEYQIKVTMKLKELDSNEIIVHLRLKELLEIVRNYK